jgi:hypothetical protein
MTGHVPFERITRPIRVLRGQRVLLDAELAALYGVTNKQPDQAVRHSAGRFPEDVRFQLNCVEATELNRSQSVTGSQKHRDPRHAPSPFTEHGTIQAASVIK